VSDKIKPHHLERKAILYVRQSSAYQVQNNLESQKLQYAMRDRLSNLGWSDIEVVDEDLGRTASGTVTELVSSACLRKCAWATWVRSRPERCRALPATVGNGRSW
jgi:hypothetical protein